MTKGKENTIIMKVDVTRPAEIKDMIDITIEKYGRIDILIYNAGVVKVARIEDFSDEDYDLLIDVNLKGTYYTCKYAVPYFKKQRSGAIITLSSVATHMGKIYHADYCSTKLGVLGFTRALSLDLSFYCHKGWILNFLRLFYYILNKY